MEMLEIMEQIKARPEDGNLYLLWGDAFANKGNINQAYLCYEQASHLCEGEKSQEAKEKMAQCRETEDFEVHPASFVILSYNSKAVMQECLEAIRKNCPKGAYELIVIDSGSTDGIREWLEKQDDILLVLNEKFHGFAAGCNQGAKLANPQNDIFLLNNDAILTPGAFLNMRLALYSKKKLGAVGPVSSNVIPEQLYDTTSRSHDDWMALAPSINQPSDNPIQLAHWLQGHALLVKRRVWDQAGMLDTDFKFGGDEDLEYGVRLNTLGYQLAICKNAFIYHYGSLSMNTVSEEYLRATNQNHKLFEEKYHFPIGKILDDRHNRILTYVKEDAGAKLSVLQIYGGCSNTLNLLRYRYPNARTYAIERDSHVVKVASNYTTAYCMDIEKENLPFESESLDYILLCEIESFDDAAAVFLNLKGFLKPGGHLLIKAKNANHISVVDALVHGSLKAPWIEDCRHFYTTDDVYSMVSDCGYGIPSLSWTYNNSATLLTESQQRTLDMILSLSDAKDRNTYIHTGIFLHAQKPGEKQAIERTTAEKKETYQAPSFKVMSNWETLEFVLQTHCSVARFGDGEFDIMAGNSIPYQDYDKSLGQQLKEIASRQSDLCFVSCLPDVFEREERYNAACRNFWKGHLKHYETLYKEVCQARWYGSTFLSRPYIDLEDKSQANGYFEELRLLWENRNVLIVEGATSRSGVGNDLFANAKSLQRIICPSKNAYSRITEIEAEIVKHGRGKIVLLMLGPTAKVIAWHLHKKGLWLIDMGHIDSEYEWYKMGATSKVKLANKHTAEHNYDQNIAFDQDDAYDSSIIARID